MCSRRLFNIITSPAKRFISAYSLEVTFKVLITHLSHGQTIEQSWFLHPTLLEVNVEIVAKHYSTLLDETRFENMELRHGNQTRL